MKTKLYLLERIKNPKNSRIASVIVVAAASKTQARQTAFETLEAVDPKAKDWTNKSKTSISRIDNVSHFILAANDCNFTFFQS